MDAMEIDKENAVSYTLLVAMILALLVAVGCSKPRTEGVDVWGNVNWDGKPVSSGMVTFTPDVTKENRGHQGWAVIKDGHFDTRESSGKAVTKGPCIVSIGHKQPSTNPSHPKGTSLIVKYDQSLEIPEESGELNFDVPASYEPLVSYPDGEE